MPLLKRAKALRAVVVLGVVFTWVACSDAPPVAPEPAGKAACALCDFLGDDRFTPAAEQGAEAEAGSTAAAATDSTAAADPDSTAADVVSFADANLERAVRRALKKPEGPLTTDDLASLTRLDAEEHNIESLAGLEHATALDTLKLWGNQIADLRPLSGLTHLTFLDVGNNQVADVNALDGLTNLRWLSLWGNEVADVSALAGLKKLQTLSLWGNEIEDVRPLSGLTNLRMLHLGNNQVEDVRPLDGLIDLDWLGLQDNPIRQSTANEQVPTLIEKGVSVEVVPPNPEPEPDPEPVVSFADGNLERVVRRALGKPEGPLTAADLASLTQLSAGGQNIESLAGLEHATALVYLSL